MDDKLSSLFRIATIIVLSFSMAMSAVAGGDPTNNEQTARSPMKIVVHHRSNTCGRLIKSQWLADQQSYESTFQAMFQNLISDSKPKPVNIDFDHYAMLLLSMGQHKSGGYSVKLASDQLQVKNQRAKLLVDWIQPKSGMMTIQVMTNPCMLLQLPRLDYHFIDIVDQSGKVQQKIHVE